MCSWNDTDVCSSNFELCLLFYVDNLYAMMMSCTGSFFNVTGPLCGEFTGDRWIPLTKTSNVDFDVVKQTVEWQMI